MPPTTTDSSVVVDINNVLKSAKKSHVDPIQKTQRAFQSGKTWDMKYRRRQLKQLLTMYEELEGEMYTALEKDLRRSKMESTIFEVEFLKNDLRNILGNFQDWLKPEKTYKRFMDFFASPMVYREAYGVVLIIGTWNFPFKSTLLPLAGAIAAGNCAVLKAPSEDSHCFEFLQNNLQNYIDSGCYALLDKEIDEETLWENKFDYVFFTGRFEQAKRIQMFCSQFLTPTTFIIGGKSPVYIDDSADMEIAVKRILWGKCVNAGQICIGPEYILCTENVQKKFLDLVPKIIAQFYGEDVKKSADFSRMISREHFDKTLNLIRHTDKIAYGGHHDVETLYIEPTILKNVTPNDALLHNEILGPVLPIVVIKDLNEAIIFMNARAKPLAMYIFSKNSRHVEEILTKTSAGGVTVNDTLMHLSAESLPFGGVGPSGIGSYRGRTSVETFSHHKSVLKKSLNLFGELVEQIRYPPYNNFNLRMVRETMRKRRQIDLGFLKYLLVFVLGVLFAFVIDSCIDFL